MDGIVVNYDPKSATGIVRTEDGKMFPFRKADWHESRAPRRDGRVDLEVEGDKATEDYYFQEQAKPAPETAAKGGGGLDIGLIAGGYAIVFFGAAIFDALFHAMELDANDLVALFVILDILTLAAWIWGTKYKLVRGFATLCAVSVTALALVIAARHMLQAA